MQVITFSYQKKLDEKPIPAGKSLGSRYSYRSSHTEALKAFTKPTVFHWIFL